MTHANVEDAVLRALHPDKIAADLANIVQVRSTTGNERHVLERLGEMAEGYGLASTVHEHDLVALRQHPQYPGEEAPRDELVGLSVVLEGSSRDAPRICLNGHVDVVNPGTVPWNHDPFGGTVEGGFVYGRGSADMKGGVIAALHAIAAVKSAVGQAPGDIVLQAVSSEEDGGAGTFAALEHDARFDACIIPEPTGFKLVCAHAGALTFVGVVPGVSAHAALRLEGISAIDRYIPIHEALWEYERQINSNVQNPLMVALPLPYAIVVGRVDAGQWSSQVPDYLRFEGRVGVRVGESIADAMAAFEAVVHDACPQADISWNGGKFASAETPLDHPLVGVTGSALADELHRPAERCGFPGGADMRLYTARGIPCVMVGTHGLELAHAVNERVAVEDVYKLARVLARALVRLQWREELRADAVGN
jgi:acetylornithine deacetylase